MPNPCRQGMERPIRDIQQHIDYVGTLAEEAPDPKTRWQLQKRVAASVWQRDAKAYYEEQGAEFFDFGQWQLDQAYASYLYHESIKRYRKRQGDRQILARLDELNNVPREDGGYKVTGARRKVIRAIVGLATSSGVLYCSYDGLARAARVSPRSAHSIRAELERLGVLKRVRTGGRAEDGSRQSNKYIVKWDKLRDILGIACCYASNWHGELQRTVERKPFHNVYYNYEGYAHYSKSARQKRRERQRAREHAALAAQAPKVDNHVEKSAPEKRTKAMGLENEASDQGFCALTDLKERKTSKILQPVRSLLSYCRRIVEKRTPLRGSSDARHEGGMPESLRDTLDNRPAGGTTWCFDVSKLSQTSLQRLGRVAPGRIVPLLAEIDQMTRSNPSLETPEDMQWHAEELLHILADADGIPR